MWAAFVFHKKENEAPKTAAKQRQNKKDDDLIILDKDLFKPQGKKKKRTDDEEVPQGKEAEEATSANDDKRKNAQLQAAKKEFRAFVQSNDVKPENYVSTLKKFFGQNQMMSSLWAELKRQRQGADVTIQEAWTQLCKGPASVKAKNNIVWSMMAESPGKWQSRLMEHVASIKESKKIEKKTKPIPFDELAVKMGLEGAQTACDKGMYKKWTNKFGIDMVNKVSQEMTESVEMSKQQTKTRSVQYTHAIIYYMRVYKYDVMIRN